MEENTFFTLIKYNKKRFIILAIGLVIILAALICAMIYDPMPLIGTIIAGTIMGGAVGTTIYHWIKYKKWEDENNKE